MAERKIVYSIEISKGKLKNDLQQLRDMFGDTFNKANLKEIELRVKTNIGKDQAMAELKQYQQELQGMLSKFQIGEQQFDYKKVALLNSELDRTNNLINKVESDSGEAKKTFSGFGEMVQKSGQRIKEFFTAGLLVNAVTGAARKLFGAINDGLQNAIKNDSVAASKLQAVQGQFQSIFDGIGKAILPVINLLNDTISRLLTAAGIAKAGNSDNQTTGQAIAQAIDAKILESDEWLLKQAKKTYNDYWMLRKVYAERYFQAADDAARNEALSEIAYLDKVYNYFKSQQSAKVQTVKQTAQQINEIKEIEASGEQGTINQAIDKTGMFSSLRGGSGGVPINGMGDIDDYKSVLDKLILVKNAVNDINDAFKKIGVDVPPELEKVLSYFNNFANVAQEIATTGTISISSIITIVSDVTDFMNDLTESLNNMFFSNGINDTTLALKNQGDIVDELNTKLGKYNDYLRTSNDYLSWLKNTGASEEDQAKQIQKDIDLKKKQQKEIAAAYGLKINEDGSFDQNQIDVIKGQINNDQDVLRSTKNWFSQQVINTDTFHIGTRFSHNNAQLSYLNKAKWLLDRGYILPTRYQEIVRNVLNQDPSKIQADLAFLTSVVDTIMADNEASKSAIDQFTGLSSDISGLENDYNELLGNGNDLLEERKRLLEDINKLLGYGLIDVENLYQQDQVFQELLRGGYSDTAALDELSGMGFKNQIGAINIEVNEATGDSVDNAINARLINLFR